MAKIVLGIGTSHGPLLSTPPDMWHLRAEWDRSQIHPYQGRGYSYEELRTARRGENLEAQITPEQRRRRFDACQVAIEKLAQVWAAAKPDVAVIFGNDQMEIFGDTLIPAFSVMHGERIVNSEMSEARRAKLPPGIAEAAAGHIPPGGANYPGSPELAHHIVTSLMLDNFDVAVMKKFPTDETPHAFGFIYRRVMRDSPVPSVPLLQNTFFPPNQPSSGRCYRFGRSVAKAVQNWKSDASVALFASGGLSHFVIDEQLDLALLEALRKGSADQLTGIREELLQSGSSEMKNWIALAGAIAETELDFRLVNYVPCYRSEAGTGTANAFVFWR